MSNSALRWSFLSWRLLHRRVPGRIVRRHRRFRVIGQRIGILGHGGPGVGGCFCSRTVANALRFPAILRHNAPGKGER